MNKSRIAESAKQLKGRVEEAARKVLGVAKLVADSKDNKIAGKIQNAVGGLSDAIKK